MIGLNTNYSYMPLVLGNHTVAAPRSKEKCFADAPLFPFALSRPRSLFPDSFFLFFLFSFVEFPRARTCREFSKTFLRGFGDEHGNLRFSFCLGKDRATRGCFKGPLETFHLYSAIDSPASENGTILELSMESCASIVRY